MMAKIEAKKPVVEELLPSLLTSSLTSLVYLLLLEDHQQLRVGLRELQDLEVGRHQANLQVNLIKLQDLGELLVIHLRLVDLQDFLKGLQYQLVVFSLVDHSSEC